MQLMKANKKYYYPFMDTFRGVAVFWVILHHVYVFFFLDQILGRYQNAFAAFARVGFLGVDMFFVISGFLITGLLIDDLDSNIRKQHFYIRRCFKILPQYFALVAVGIGISYCLSPFDIKSISSQDPNAYIFTYFLFFQNYATQIPVLAHTWSLAIEEHFYFFYPLFLTAVTCVVQKKEH